MQDKAWTWVTLVAQFKYRTGERVNLVWSMRSSPVYDRNFAHEGHYVAVKFRPQKYSANEAPSLIQWVQET